MVRRTGRGATKWAVHSTALLAFVFLLPAVGQADPLPVMPKSVLVKKAQKTAKKILLTKPAANRLKMTEDERDAELSVFSRPHKEYDADNFRTGSFIFAPSITGGEKHTDNVFSTSSRHRGDWIQTITPDLRVSSDFARHMLALDVQGEKGSYKKFHREGYTDYSARVDGRYDIDDLLTLPVTVNYGRGHSMRGDPGESNGTSPTINHTSAASGGIHYATAFLDILAKAGMQRITYENDTLVSGAVVNNKDRNRNEYVQSISAGLTDNSYLAPFVYGSKKQICYVSPIDDYGVDRDSNEWEAGVGARFNFSKITRLNVRYGRAKREFDDAKLHDIHAVVFGGGLIWEPTTLLGINLTSQRVISEAPLANAGASLDDTQALRLTYELLPNIMVRPQIEYLTRNYATGSTYELHRLTSRLELTYKINHNVWSTFEYANIRQDQKIQAATPTNTDTNTMKFSLKLQF